MIYLAIPYSHPNKDVVQARFEVVSEYAGRLIQHGYIVFSPITHGHAIIQFSPLPTDWHYWQKSCQEFFKSTTKLIVLKLEGWHESSGVAAEIKIAQEMNIPIEYINPDWAQQYKTRLVR